MDATTPAWPSLSWAPASRRCAARGLRARARSHEDVHRRGPHTRPRELHELGRHEFRARAGDAGKVSRAQVGLRHRQSHLQRRSAAFRAVELGEVQPRKGAKNTKVPSRGKQRLGRFLPDRFSCQKLGFALSALFRGHSISEFGLNTKHCLLNTFPPAHEKAASVARRGFRKISAEPYCAAFTLSSSISKMSVEFGPMSLPAPRSP